MDLSRKHMLVAGFLALLGLAASPSPLPSASPVSVYPKRRPAVEPIWVGEKSELTVSFLGFTGLNLEIEVMPFEKVNDRRSYHAQARVRIAKWLGLFYSLDDLAETWIDYEGIFSHRFHLLQKESKLQREAWEEHDALKGETVYRNSSQKQGENPENTRRVAAIPKLGQDTFSSYFYLRSLPLEIGDIYRVPVVSECNSIEVRATVQGVDLVRAAGEKRQALQIRLEKLDALGNPISGQNNLVWLSNDERRILLRVDVTTRFGHVLGELKEFSPGKATTP